MNFKKTLFWFGAIGSIASIISLLIIFIPINDDNINISINTIDLEKLTQSTEEIEPELKVEYKYKNQEINNLWKYNIQLENKSKKTIIGIGNLKNLLTDNLTLLINDNYEILDFKKTKSDFSNNIVIKDSLIMISFEQWRPNEIVQYTFYVKSNLKTPTPIILSKLSFRQIVNGDISFSYQNPDDKNIKITEIIPVEFLQVGYVISIIFSLLFIGIITIFLVKYPFSIYKINKWKKKNYSKYSELIKRVITNDSEKLNLLLRSPDKNPEVFWKSFPGDKFPDVSVNITNDNKPYQLGIFFSVTLIIYFSLIITIIDLIYIFPLN
jgi:hypothetical protein